VTQIPQGLLDRLERELHALQDRRQLDGFANDMFEAIDDLLDLGRRLRAGDTKTNYAARVQQEEKLWGKLRAELGKRTAEFAIQYRPVFDASVQLLSLAREVDPSKTGYHDFRAIVTEQFAFLLVNYGFAIVQEEPVKVRFSSGKVFVQLACVRYVSSSCSFGSESDHDRLFWIDDLLYMHGDERYKSLSNEVMLDEPNATEEWFTSLAGMCRQYGHDVFVDRPGIFEKLAMAQKARDAEYSEEAERRYGPGGSDVM
jgi:hypothetical protein